MIQEQIRRVAVTVTVMLDYDEFYEACGAIKTNPKPWSPAIEFGRAIAAIEGVYDVVSVTNLTMQNTGKDFEEEPIPGDATDE